MKKSAVCAATCVFLIGCGSDSDDQQVSIAPTGQFFNSLATGHVFPASTGGLNTACQQERELNYLETDIARIYGFGEVTESDFYAAANQVAGQLTQALQGMGLTWEEFLQQRSGLTSTGRQYLISHLAYFDEAAYNDDLEWGDAGPFPYSHYFDAELPDNWETMPGEQRSHYAERFLATLSPQAQINALRMYYDIIYANDEATKTERLADETLPVDKVLVCLNDSMDMGIGEGAVFGITLMPLSKNERAAAPGLVRHELVHFLQQNLVGGSQRLPHWFNEGQAVYIAGQSVAKKEQRHQFNPAEVTNYQDQWVHFSNESTAYNHYALAYSYLANHNAPQEIYQMLNLAGSAPADPAQIDGFVLYEAPNAHPDFEYAFARYMKDANNEPMPYVDFVLNYHTLPGW